MFKTETAERFRRYRVRVEARALIIRPRYAPTAEAAARIAASITPASYWPTCYTVVVEVTDNEPVRGARPTWTETSRDERTTTPEAKP